MTPDGPATGVPARSRIHRLSELDALRGIAALNVVLLHYTADFHRDFHPARYSAPSWGYGAYGVHLFFLISGFVILMTAERAGSPKDFVLSRFSRLYPPYWYAVIFTTLLLISTSVDSSMTVASVIRRGIVGLTMFQYWLRVGSVDSVYWTLQVEMSFYLIILFLIWRKAVDSAIFLMTGLVVAALIDHLAVARPLGGAYAFFYGLFFLETAYLFTIGMVLYKSRTAFRWYYPPIIFLCLLCPATANYFPNTPWRDTLVSASLAVLLWAAVNGHGRWLLLRPLIFLGSISYSLYLIHHWLGFLILTRLDAYDWEPNVALATALVIAIVLAAAMRRWIEVPFLYWFRNRSADRRTMKPHQDPALPPTHEV